MGRNRGSVDKKMATAAQRLYNSKGGIEKIEGNSACSRTSRSNN